MENQERIVRSSLRIPTTNRSVASSSSAITDILISQSSFQFQLSERAVDPEKLASVQSKMSSSSKKHGNFVNEPIGHKSARDVPGVGPAISKQLASNGTQSVSRPSHSLCVGE